MVLSGEFDLSGSGVVAIADVVVGDDQHRRSSADLGGLPAVLGIGQALSGASTAALSHCLACSRWR